MTVVDVTLSFPQILLALAFVAALGPSLVTIIVVLGLTGWERYARVVRAEVLALREKDFVEAARAHRRRRRPHPAAATSCPTRSRRSSCSRPCRWPRPSSQEAALSFLGVGSAAPIRRGGR